MTHSHSAAPPSPAGGISSGGRGGCPRCNHPLPDAGLSGTVGVSSYRFGGNYPGGFGRRGLSPKGR